MRALRRFLLVSAIAGAFSAPAQTTSVPVPAKAPADTAADARKRMEESIARQRESLKKQGVAQPPAGSFFATPWSSAPPALGPAPGPPGCDPLSEEQAAPWIARAATETKLEPALLKAVIRRESAFVPCAVSAKGAMGMMQLMPDTAARLDVADPFDAAANIAAGARYLKEMLDRFKGKTELALAAYNAGPQTVEQANGQVPDIAETKDYVKAILDALKQSAAASK